MAEKHVDSEARLVAHEDSMYTRKHVFLLGLLRDIMQSTNKDGQSGSPRLYLSA